MGLYQGTPHSYSSTETTSCSVWCLKRTGERMGEQKKMQNPSFVTRSGSLHVSTSPCSLVMQVKILLSLEKVSCNLSFWLRGSGKINPVYFFKSANQKMLGQEELRYWGLAEELLEPCCLLNYFPNTASARQEKEEESQLEKSQVDLFLRETHIM